MDQVCVVNRYFSQFSFGGADAGPGEQIFAGYDDQSIEDTRGPGPASDQHTALPLVEDDVPHH
jgi:hypothetical protein